MRPRRHATAELRRRLVVFSLLVSQVLTATGFPLPALASTNGKDTSRPFPCMDRACGCMSAEQCWRSCCCFSNREKLAWARANHVEPPDYVLQACEQEETCSLDAAVHSHETTAHETTSHAAPSRCCCKKKRSLLESVECPKRTVASPRQTIVAKKIGASCCERKVTSCCQRKSEGKAITGAEAQNPQSNTGKTIWVLGLQARQCRGEGPLGLFADLPSVPPESPAVYQNPLLFLGTIPVDRDHVLSISYSPRVPPPRVA